MIIMDDYDSFNNNNNITYNWVKPKGYNYFLDIYRIIKKIKSIFLLSLNFFRYLVDVKTFY